MAAYRMHVTTSGILGAATVAAAWLLFPDQVTLQASAIAFFAAFIGGMIPDIDHDTGTALVECSGLFATCLPAIGAVLWAGELDLIGTSGWLIILPVHYALHALLRKTPLFHDRTGFFGFLRNILVAALCNAGIVFVLASTGWDSATMSRTWWIMTGVSVAIIASIPIFTRFTVHRGVWHTIPTIAIYALLFHLAVADLPTTNRYMITAAAAIGGLSHLILDEIYSVDFDGVVPRIKPSMGSALSLWKAKAPLWSAAVYILTGALLFVALTEDSKPPSPKTQTTRLNAQAGCSTSHTTGPKRPTCSEITL